MKKIPIPTSKQYKRLLAGEKIEVIPAKKGHRIYLCADGKHYTYISIN